jgi:hypothetical protein
VVFRCEAFDLAEDGDAVCYFRRGMKILAKVMDDPGAEAAGLLDSYTTFEKEEIHPPLSKVMLECLVQELELMDYLEVKDGKMYVTDRGMRKVESFRAGLSPQEREALGM